MNSDYKEQYAAKIASYYQDLEIRIMADIVRRIQKVGEITSTADYQINRLRILGYSSEDIEKELKKALNASYPQMFELYDKVIEEEYTRSKAIYEQINAKFIPFEKNYQLQQITSAIMLNSIESLQNISGSLGFYLDYGNGKRVITPLAEIYQGYLDAACIDIVSGAFDYNTVLRKVVTQLTNSGLRAIDYASGWHNRVEVAARRAVMTGVSQVTGRIVEYNAAAMGTEYFEVAWHAGARPTHAAWQGKVWSEEELYSVCGMGTVTGLLGANCYHEYYPFFPGISERNWSDEWLDKKNAEENKPKAFKGKEYTLYQAKQKQRKMETAMRAQREKVQLLQKGGADRDEITLHKAKYQGQLDEYAQFSRKMGLKQEKERIYIDGRGRVALKKYIFMLSDSTDKWAEEARRELLKSERSISRRNKETLELYGANGNYILTRRGNSNSVRLSPADYPKLKGAVITHNHPSGGSLSITDICFLKNVPVSEIRAATIDGVYYMRKPRKWPSSISNSKALKKAINNIRKELHSKYAKLYNEGKITKIQRHTMFSDEVNRVFSERYGIEYGRETYE